MTINRSPKNTDGTDGIDETPKSPRGPRDTPTLQGQPEPQGPNQGPPTLEELREKGVSGTEMVASSGITADGEVKELPIGSVVVQVMLKTVNPVKDIGNFKQTISNKKGQSVIILPSHEGEITIQAAFKDLNQGLLFREEVKRQYRENSVVSISQNPGSIATHGNTVMAFGNAFTYAREGYNYSQNKHGRAQNSTRLKADKSKASHFAHSLAGDKAREHAKRVGDLSEERELPPNIEIVRIKLPKGFKPTEKGVGYIAGIIDLIKSNKEGMSRVIVNGDIIMIMTGGERSPGHCTKRVGKFLNEAVKRIGMTIVKDHISGVRAYKLASGETIYQGDFDYEFPRESGIFETKQFQKAYDKDDRNKSVATRKLGKETDGYVEVLSSQTQNYEIAIPRDEITVGREREIGEIKREIEKIMGERPRSGVVIVESEAGGGKTHFAKDVRNMAEESNAQHLYARAEEEDTTVPYAYIRSLGLKYLELLPPIKLQLFTTLRHFIHQTPEAKLSHARKEELLVLKSNKNTIAAEMDRLKKEVCADHPTVAQIDDLHWADEASIDIIATMIFLDENDQRNKNLGHLFVIYGRPEEQYEGALSTGLPPRIRSNVGSHKNSKTIHLNRIENSPGTYDKTIEFIVAKLGNLITPTASREEISETFAQQTYELYGNHPLSTEHFIRLLVEKGYIRRSENGSLKMPTNEEVNSIEGLESIDTIIQNRFSEVSEEGKQIFDILITLEEPITESVLITLMKTHGLSESKTTRELAKLEQRKLVTKTQKAKKEVTFKPTHHLIVTARKAQLQETQQEGQIAHRYVEALKASSEEVKGDVSTTLEFKLLLKATSREGIDTKTQAQELIQLMKTAQVAIAKELHINNNLSAIAIAEQTILAIAPLEKALKGHTHEAALIKRKCTIMTMLAEAYRRTGENEESQKTINSIEAEAKRFPEGSILIDTQHLELQTLNAEVTFLITQDEKKVNEVLTGLQEAITRLSVSTTVEGVKGENRPEVVIAKAALLLSKLRVIMIRSRNPETEADSKQELAQIEPECETILEALDKISPKNKNAKKMALILRRQMDNNEYQKLIAESQGIDEETIYMQRLTPEQQSKMAKLKRKFANTTNGWATNQDLIAESPVKVAYNYMMLARLAKFAGENQICEDVIEEGIRIANRLYAAIPIAVLHQVYGDIRVFGELGSNGIDFNNWNGEKLEKAYFAYEKGQTEISRTEEKSRDIYERALILNQTVALAAYVLRKENAETITAEEKEELKKKVEKQWNRMNRTMKKLHTEDKSNYKKESSTYGLLLRAANTLSLNLEIPEDLPRAEFTTQYQTLQSQKSSNNLTQADRNLIALRELGTRTLLRANK